MESCQTGRIAVRAALQFCINDSYMHSFTQKRINTCKQMLVCTHEPIFISSVPMVSRVTGSILWTKKCQMSGVKPLIQQFIIRVCNM